MTPPPPGPVAYDHALWSANYPELAQWVGMAQAQGYFVMACGLLNNTATSPVRDNCPGGTRAVLLNLLTAHIAKLFAPLGGSPSPDQVGRISNGSQGGVSVAFDNGTTTQSEKWYQQTKYGSLYWAMTAPYRLARYRPGRQPYLGVGNVWQGGWGGPGQNNWNS